MKFEFDSWECPKCNYVIMDTLMQSMRYDFGCPRCKTLLARFIGRIGHKNSDSAKAFTDCKGTK